MTGPPWHGDPNRIFNQLNLIDVSSTSGEVASPEFAKHDRRCDKSEIGRAKREVGAFSGDQPASSRRGPCRVLGASV